MYILRDWVRGYDYKAIGIYINNQRFGSSNCCSDVAVVLWVTLNVSYAGSLRFYHRVILKVVDLFQKWLVGRWNQNL